ncbi:GAF domain-containing protein [Limnothrix sp. FACHB-1083]|uniref:GAF domain-containing protein n=1 Tax=unclassified Limnothrix TaxID=2632864 RepID=UPI001680340C|nr:MULTISPECIES: GAF domain-containing protein [unclassified Limnothrix]MBD2161364.1 GAF domain-containing protein [Limnothrix sp. FACHB-1083]MBD2192125.1 GAF domain-containing protein [Limnothrix sp. FACHB-1088]
MTFAGTGSFLASLTRPDRVGLLTQRVQDLPVAEFVCLLDFITAEFQQFLRAFDLVNNAALESILEQILDALTLKIGLILQAERTTIFLLDPDRAELWARPNGDQVPESDEIRIPLNVGITGRSAATGEVVNMANVQQAAGFELAFDGLGDRPTEALLCMPIRSTDGAVVAVVQLLNKTTAPAFDREDEARFREFAESIGIILESCQSFYQAARNQRGVAALLKVTTLFAQTGLELDRVLQAVMAEARDFMQAEYGTLYRLDRDTGRLRTTFADGRSLEVSSDRGLVGHVVRKGQPLNLSYAPSHEDFDALLDRPHGLNTRNALCLPIFDPSGQLIGVSQLLNRKQGNFTASDEAFMRAFNTQAGIALENARLFDSVLTEQQYQKDILRSLSNGVISTDLQGRVVTINEAALELLGCPVRRDGMAGRRSIQTIWEQQLLKRPVWEIIPIESLETRLKDSLSTGARHRVPEQALRVGRYFSPQEGTVWVVPQGNNQVRLWNDPARPLEYLNPDDMQLFDRNVNLAVNPLTDLDGKVRGGLVVLEDISREQRLKATMSRYMTPEVAERAVELGADMLTGERKDVTILFCDIRGYTSLAEALDATEVVALLNQYFETMVEAIFDRKGTLDKFIGDALMAVFGAPLPLEEDHAWLAVLTALDMRDRLKVFNRALVATDRPPLRVGIGISSGEVIVGNIGSRRRMDYTAIGDAVNVSSRLEGLTKEYGCDIILSEATYERCADRLWVRELDRVRVKGRTKPIRIFELIGDRARPLSFEDETFLEQYELGKEAFNRFHFHKAMVHFAAAQQLRPHDHSVKLHIERATQYLDCPPPEYWDGVFNTPGV